MDFNVELTSKENDTEYLFKYLREEFRPWPKRRERVYTNLEEVKKVETVLPNFATGSLNSESVRVYIQMCSQSNHS